MSRSLLVNLTFLRPGAVGGTERYATDLLRSLAQADDLEGWNLTLAVGSGFVDAYPDLATAFPVREMPAGLAFAGRAGRLVAERTWLRLLARGYDAVHHLGGTAPNCRPPTTVTIYDVQYVTHPEFFSGLKRRFLRRAVPRSVGGADSVCVMSVFVADQLVDLFGVTRDRIHVVPPALTPRGEMGDVGLPGQIRSPFVLYPAVTWPHKNHRVLLDALGDQRLAGVQLVLTGAQGPAHAEFLEAVHAAGLGQRVKHLGRVDDEVLDVLYRRALALVFPSLHEGFGQPVVEAMQRGCPVVVARSGALPEVVGDAGVLIAPLDPIAWADAIDSLMQDDIRDPQRDLGLTRSQMWSAERTAAAQFAAYRHLCC